MQDWSPQLYCQFEAERTRPARDLLARILRIPVCILPAIWDVGRAIAPNF